jgi:anti-sigma regulatory factor (Ser/Thr protein kinase)
MAEFSSDPVRQAGAGLRALVVLSRDAAEVGHARRWLRQALTGEADDRQIDEACLVTSELVTNALRHGLGQVVVHTSLADDGIVQIAVTDWSEEAPRLLPVDPQRVGGVGLRVVEALAKAWGVAAFPGGKTVWASIGPRAGVGGRPAGDEVR